MPAPGEVFDCKGYPIYPGDLLRRPHFRGRRRKQYYLYHVAVLDGEHMVMRPTCYLEPTKRNIGGTCRIDQELADQATILSGHGPNNRLHFEERPRRKKQ